MRGKNKWIIDGACSYEIRLKGHLDSRRARQFEEMSIAYDSDGTTVLSGPVIDQAALHGVLRTVRDLGMPLVSVHQAGSRREAEFKSIMGADAGCPQKENRQ